MPAFCGLFCPYWQSSARGYELLPEDCIFSLSLVEHQIAFNALTLLVGQQEWHPAVKKLSGGCWHCYLSGARCILVYMAQLMPLPLTVSCFSKIQIGFTFLLLTHLGSPG